MYVAAYSSVFGIHFCSLSGFRLWSAPCSTGHSTQKVQPWRGVIWKLRLFCKMVSCPFLGLSNCKLKCTSCLMPRQTCSVVFGFFLIPDQSLLCTLLATYFIWFLITPPSLATAPLLYIGLNTAYLKEGLLKKNNNPSNSLAMQF